MLNEQFVNANWKEEWLWKDATKVTSGFVGEHYFEKTYLQNNNSYRYSTGWYHCFLGNTDVPFVFFLGPRLTELDKEILSRFGSECFFCQAYFDNGLHFLYHEKISQFKNNGFQFNEIEFIDILGLTKLRDPVEAKAESKNRNEFNSYISYFMHERIFNNVFLDRYFCNGFLVKYFRQVIDFDFIIKNSKNEYIIADVKFRYPMPDGSFGINIAPGNLYKELNDSFTIYNLNFIKPNSINENLANFISNNHLKTMYYSQFDPRFVRDDNIYPKSFNSNQTGTSYSGNTVVYFYKFPKSEYTQVDLLQTGSVLPF